MNWKWATAWTVWLVILVVSFGFLEGYAIHTGGTTLSAYVWHLSKGWPPLPFVAGLVAGGLAVHFWWTNQGLK